MAVKYGEFKFPSDKGFTGSAGKTMVKAYARGGYVMKAKGGATHEDEAMDRALLKKMVKPAAMKAKGGKVHEDEAMDKKLMKQMVKPAAMKGSSNGAHEDEAEDKKLIERMVKPAARKAGGGRACG